MTDKIVAPFPYFGGKSKVAPLVWERFGNVDNYVEPFGGSLAVLLGRPDNHEWWSKKETVGDYSGMIVNVFRSIKQNPEEVVKFANYPVSEVDLTARHLYLVKYEETLTKKLMSDPEFFDPKAAGWWIWGVSAWVGGDWMTGKGPYRGGEPQDGLGVYRKLPMVAGSHGGKGIHKPLKNAGANADNIDELMEAKILDSITKIHNRVRRVRITCGDWSRLTRSATTPAKGKMAGVFLDPPYAPEERRNDLYGKSDAGESSVHLEAMQWALEAGIRSDLRIAYCTYENSEETENFVSNGWHAERWTAAGGYGLQSDNRALENRNREIIWFSPNCQNS